MEPMYYRESIVNSFILRKKLKNEISCNLGHPYCLAFCMSFLGSKCSNYYFKCFQSNYLDPKVSMTKICSQTINNQLLMWGAISTLYLWKKLIVNFLPGVLIEIPLRVLLWLFFCGVPMVTKILSINFVYFSEKTYFLSRFPMLYPYLFTF